MESINQSINQSVSQSVSQLASHSVSTCGNIQIIKATDSETEFGSLILRRR